MTTRYHVINRLTSAKLGDYGMQLAAEERAAVLNATTAHPTLGPVIGGPVYEVRSVQLSLNDRQSFVAVPRKASL